MEAKGTTGKAPVTKQAALDYYNKFVQPQILQEFKAHPKLEWATFTLLSNDKSSTVKVVATNPEDQGWKSFTSKIQPTLKKAPTPIQVEIVAGQINVLGDDGTNGQKLSLYPYALGRSCNIKGVPKGCGTLGGYLKITDNADNIEAIYGLTNNHVVNISPTTQKQDPIRPLYVYTSNQVITPSQEDFKKMQENLKTTPEDSKETQEKSKKTQGNSKKAQEKPKKPQEESKNPVEPVSIGTLKYASGRCVTPAAPQVMLDWALVQTSLQKYKAERNENKKIYKANSTPNDDVPLALKGKVIAGSIGNRLYGGMTVYKFGRTTGWTCGEISDTRVTVNLADAESWRGGKIERQANVTHTAEWAAYGDNCTFCKGGDSGSWVLDSEARLVGILWGNVEIQGLTAVFITDIHTILDNIRTKPEFQGKTINVLTG